MSNSESYSRRAYASMKKQSASKTALYPDTPFEFLSEDIQINWANSPVMAVANRRSKNNRPSKMPVGPFEGTVNIYVEPKRIGDVLTGILGEATDSTLNAGASYQHDYVPANSLPYYTLDIPIAGKNYVKRFVDTYFKGAEFSIQDNKLKAAVGVMAKYVFTNAKVLTAVGSGTALNIDQTTGLTTSDTLIVLDKDDYTTELMELTISSITDEKNLVVSTIGSSIEVGDIVVIKRNSALQTSDYDRGEEMIFSGGASAYFYHGDAPLQNLSTKTNLENFTFSVQNDLEARWAAVGADVVDRMPSSILTKGYEVSGNMKQYHLSPENMHILREMGQVGLRIEFESEDAIDSNSATAASATVETDGTDTITVAVDATGEAGNDYAIVVQQGTGALAASLSGKLITVDLDTTPANNTTTAVASAINALSGVTTSDTGTDLVTVTDNPDKIEFAGGRDANEVAKLRFDVPYAVFEPFTPVNSEDAIVDEDINWKAHYYDAEDRDVRIRLRNSVDDY